MDVSIVIPTKNGGHLFEKVLDAVFKQKTEYEYEERISSLLRRMRFQRPIPGCRISLMP